MGGASPTASMLCSTCRVLLGRWRIPGALLPIDLSLPGSISGQAFPSISVPLDLLMSLWYSERQGAGMWGGELLCITFLFLYFFYLWVSLIAAKKEKRLGAMFLGVWDLVAKCSAGYPNYTCEAGCQHTQRCSLLWENPRQLPESVLLHGSQEERGMQLPATAKKLGRSCPKDQLWDLPTS